MAAFDLARRLRGGVYPKAMVQAVDLFAKLPCRETAVILIAACPEVMPVLGLANSSLAFGIPKDLRGPAFQGLDEWMASFYANIRAVDAIHGFVLQGATEGTISIGFHRMRDQQVLFDRLATIGIRKWFFSNGRQFLRDRITRDGAAFRAANDLICIHGVDSRGERFWNALGGEPGPQWHLQSEIQYDLGGNTVRFAALIDELQHREQDGA
jgi:hypothetical protein